MKYKIELISVGKTNYSEIFEIESSSPEKVRLEVLRECRKYVMSSLVELELAGNDTYNVKAQGWKHQGQVKIQEIRE